jgi:hypothetical protein
MYLQAMANLRVQLSAAIQDADATANVARAAADAEPAMPAKQV